MKQRYFGVMVVMLVATLACGLIVPTSAPNEPSVGTIVAATLQALTQEAPSGEDETQPVPPSGTSVSFRNVSFVIPFGLATDANSEVIPAISETDDAPPWEFAPEHLFFTLNGYTVYSNIGLMPAIMVFPALEYAIINPGASQSIPQLQAILADSSTPLNVDTIPGVPYFNAGQIMAAQAAIVNFKNGSGVRSLSHYTQYQSPIVKDGQIYQYHGLTSDGRYYIIAVLPIISPLQSTSDNPSADGIAFPDFATADPAELDAYYQAMTDKLNAAPSDSFQPSLTQLDALIQSFTITSQ